MTFTVTLSNASSTPVTVGFATVNLTAIVDQDYTLRTGSLTFVSGVIRKTITVPILNDPMDEPNETFNVTLNSPSANVTIADAAGTGIIVDDDDPPKISINDLSISESGGNANFTVSLSNASSTPVTVSFATSNVTAIADQDYTVRSGRLTFASGETRQSITVPIINDTIHEPNEIFSVILSAPSPNATIADTTGMGTIVNNDSKPTVRISDAASVREPGGTATFTVSLSNPSSTTVTVKYATGNGTGTSGATAGSDYTTTSGTLGFLPGVTGSLIKVAIRNDFIDEPSETYKVTLSNLSANATMADSVGVGIIVDNDVVFSVPNRSTLKFIPPHIAAPGQRKGNNDFSGHGPSFSVSASIRIDNFTDSNGVKRGRILATITMFAQETNANGSQRSDFTAAGGSTPSPGLEIYLHSRPITRIRSGLISNLSTRRDPNEHADSSHSPSSGSLVSRFTVTGDADGGDAGIRTGVKTFFNTISLQDER